MGAESITRDDMLAELAEMCVPETPPPGYYSERELYEAAAIAHPELSFEAFRHGLRKQVRSGRMIRYYVGRNVFYGKG